MTIFLTVYLAIGIGPNAMTDAMTLPVATMAQCRQTGEENAVALKGWVAKAQRDNPLVYATRFTCRAAKNNSSPTIIDQSMPVF
jgi:hypothetical protein